MVSSSAVYQSRGQCAVNSSGPWSCCAAPLPIAFSSLALSSLVGLSWIFASSCFSGLPPNSGASPSFSPLRCSLVSHALPLGGRAVGVTCRLLCPLWGFFVGPPLFRSAVLSSLQPGGSTCGRAVIASVSVPLLWLPLRLSYAAVSLLFWEVHPQVLRPLF